MGTPDSVEQFYTRWGSKKEGAGQAALGSVSYLSAATDTPSGTAHGATVSSATSARRYTGRSSAKRSHSSTMGKPAIAAASPVARQSVAVGVAMLGARIARSVPVPWSLRLVISVTALSVLLLVFRISGLATQPIDASVGVEATNAATVNVLVGHTAPALDPARFLLPPAPWHGSAPVNPTSGLPLYSWTTAGLMPLVGTGAWVGRLVSVLFSLAGGVLLFAIVRRTAGARAALYALLFYSVAPISVLLGQEFAPFSLILAAQAWLLLALVRWRTLESAQRGKAAIPFVISVGSAALLGLIDPGALFMAAPAIYIVIMPSGTSGPSGLANGMLASWRDSWHRSHDRSKAIWIASALVGMSLLWWAFSQGSADALSISTSDGGGGVATIVISLLNGGTYVQIIGLVVERLLTVAGLLLFAAGILYAARPPLQMLFHVWFAAGLIHVLLDAGRLPVHEDVLLPLILPACALAGIGAAWAGALPARVWLAIKEQRRDKEADYAISPHTAWLLDLPEERVRDEKPSRPQAQLALGRSIAHRSQTDQLKLQRAWFLAAGHVAVFILLGLIVAGGVPTLMSRLQPTVQDAELAGIGSQVASLVPASARIVVAGPYAAELFYASGHTGWSLSTDDFSMAKLQLLQAQGAAYLLSADQDWLGHHPDYRGLITSYSVVKLAQNFILFDLNTRPADSDRQYFLESGHTLGGKFLSYWQTHGGVARLGYPISEEEQVVNPLDGQTRTVQYFERAVLEAHNEYAGTANEIMLASVGLWVTQGDNFARIQPFKSTQDDWYFAETGHSVKQAFLLYWQQQGGLAAFGYPISEELPEINQLDGKVYTVQYFERARFEWHPTFAGTPDEVQLGLIGKQALELSGK